MSIKICKSYCFFMVEIMKWLVVVALLIIISVGGYYCGYNLYKILIIFFIVLLSGYVLLLTRLGHRMVFFMRESYEEVCKVIWPTFRDSFHTTVIVIVFTILMSLILWGLDSILVRVVSFFLRL